MNITYSYAYGILNTFFVLLVSPLFISLIKKVKAPRREEKVRRFCKPTVTSPNC